MNSSSYFFKAGNKTLSRVKVSKISPYNIIFFVKNKLNMMKRKKFLISTLISFIFPLMIDYKNFKNLKYLTGHTKTVICLLKLEDGKFASGSVDSSIRIWDSKDEFKCIRTLTGHTYRIWCLLNLDDGKFASGSSDSSIRIWGF
jgi:WD40 repeat protein